jgi:SprT-like family protein
MQVETALFLEPVLEPVEQIYARVFRTLKPQTDLPSISVRYRRYANANSRVRLTANRLTVDISDLLEQAPAAVQEALAFILLAKLYRKNLDPTIFARYRRYLNRSDVRRSLLLIKQERGRKTIRPAEGTHFNLEELFENLNLRHFHGLMARPLLGWSLRPSRSTLGHYDPSHHVIVLSSLLDSVHASRLIVDFVMFHEMLHLKYPTEHRGVRRCVHTPEFKAAEREFPKYREAQLELRRFLERSWKASPS